MALAYPGIVASIAVRSRVELLATGFAVVVPVAVFGLLYRSGGMENVGLGVLLGYAILILISVLVASRLARRPGWSGLITAFVSGGGTFLLALAAVFFVLLLPIY